MKRCVAVVAALAALCFYAEGKNPGSNTLGSTHRFITEEKPIDSGAVSNAVSISPLPDFASENETYDWNAVGTSALRDLDAGAVSSPQNSFNEVSLLHYLLQGDQKDDQGCSLELSFGALEELESSEQQSKNEVSTSISDNRGLGTFASVSKHRCIDLTNTRKIITRD